jgi:tetratricopeptide (TPR) repeat protein
MVPFCIILAVLTAIGLLLFKAHITDSIDMSRTVGCAGVLLFILACGVMVVILLTQFTGDSRTLLLLLLGSVGLVAVLYSPFVANVIGTFFTDFIYPTGGGETKSYDIAEKLTTEGRYAEAVAKYERAIEEAPDDVPPRIFIADTYCKAGQYELAAQALDEALKLDLSAEQRCQIANRLADIYLHYTDEPEKAIEVLSGIVDAYPESTFARYARERMARIRKGREQNA